MTWKKGQSGNPKGRPRKDEAMTDELRRLLQRQWLPSGLTNRELLAMQLMGQGLQGNMDAIKYICNRVDGMPPQAIQHTGEGDAPIIVKFITSRNGNRDSST